MQAEVQRYSHRYTQLDGNRRVGVHVHVHKDLDKCSRPARSAALSRIGDHVWG